MYGKCIGAKYQEVEPGMCRAEFAAFKECVSKAVSLFRPTTRAACLNSPLSVRSSYSLWCVPLLDEVGQVRLPSRFGSVVYRSRISGLGP